MAKQEELILKVTAETDQARRDLHALEEAAEGFEEIEITPKVDTSNAKSDVQELLETVQKLSAEDATVTLAIKGAEIQQQINDIRVDLATLNSTPAEIDIQVANLAQLQGDLEQVEGAIKELDAAKAEPTVTVDTTGVESGARRAKAGIDEIPQSARGANSALANMIGNAGQDLGALGGIAGSAGVAIGQMAEYAADAKLSGEGMGSVLKSMAGVVGPIAAISIGIGAATAAFSAWRNAQKEIAENTREMTAAFEEGIGSADDWAAAVDDAFEVGTAGADAFSREMMRALETALSEEEFIDLRKGLADIGATFEDLGDIAKSVEADFAAFAATQLQTRGASEDLAANVAGLVDEWGGAQDILIDLNGLVQLGAEQFNRYGESVPIEDVIAFVEANEDFINGLDEQQEAFNNLNVDEAAANFLKLEASVDPATRAMIEAAIAQNTLADGTVDSIGAVEDYIAAKQEQARADQEAAAASEAAARRQQRLDAEFVESVNASIEAQRQRNQMLEEFDEAVAKLAIDPTFSDQFMDLVADVKDGTVDLENFNQVVAGLADSWGISEEAVRAYILQEADKQLKAEGEVAEEATVAVEDLAAAYESINDILAETPDLVGALEDAFSGVDDIFSGLAFDESFDAAFQEALDGLESFGPDLATLAANWTQIIDDGLEIDLYGNVRADDAAFLEKIGKLRDLFQEGVVNEFKQGGEAAAQAFVDAQVAAIQAAHPELSLVDIYRLMGLPDDGTIQTLVQPTIDETKRAQAEGILDALAGAGSTDPRIAQIQVALITGEMTPEEALAATMEVYQDWLGENPLEVPTSGDTTGAEEDVSGWRSATEDTTAVVPVDADPDEAEGVISDVEDGDYQATMNLGLAQQIVQGLIVSAFLDAVANKPRQAQIVAKSDNAGQIAGILDAISRNRTVDFDVRLHGVSEAERQLDFLARDRHATIHVTQRLGGDRVGGQL